MPAANIIKAQAAIAAIQRIATVRQPAEDDALKTEVANLFNELKLSNPANANHNEFIQLVADNKKLLEGITSSASVRRANELGPLPINQIFSWFEKNSFEQIFTAFLTELKKQQDELQQIPQDMYKKYQDKQKDTTASGTIAYQEHQAAYNDITKFLTAISDHTHILQSRIDAFKNNPTSKGLRKLNVLMEHILEDITAKANNCKIGHNQTILPLSWQVKIDNFTNWLKEKLRKLLLKAQELLIYFEKDAKLGNKTNNQIPTFKNLNKLEEMKKDADKTITKHNTGHKHDN